MDDGSPDHRKAAVDAHPTENMWSFAGRASDVIAIGIGKPIRKAGADQRKAANQAGSA